MNECNIPMRSEAGSAIEMRRDGQRRELVNRALCMQRDNSTLCALEYLKSHAVPAAVIQRVLLEPDRRRIPTVV